MIEPEHPRAASAVSDPLVEELRDRLPDLVEEVLRRSDLLGELDKVQAADRAAVRETVKTQALTETDDILRITNPEITSLRNARSALREHQRPPADPGGRAPSDQDKIGHSMFGFALWLGMLPPLLIWQLEQVSFDGSALAATAVLVLGFLSLRLAYVVVARAGRRFSGLPALGGACWPLLTAEVTIFLLLVWRVGPSSVKAIGVLATTAIGLVVLAVTLFLAGFTIAAGNVADTKKGEQPGRRIPRSVYRRGAYAYLAAAVVAFLLLSRTVDVPWPDWVLWLSTDLVTLVVLVSAAPLSLQGWYVPRALSTDPTRRGSAGWKLLLGTRETMVQTADEQWVAAATLALGPATLRILNETVHPAFSTTLIELNRAGLGQMRAADRVVPTAAFTRLRSVTSGITGGAIGMAGPRGAGKSTLLDAFQAGKFLVPGQRHVAVFEAVPVKYDARDFVLHLFARTCEEVIRFCNPRLETTSSRWDAWRARFRRAVPLFAVLCLWLVVGLVGTAATTATLNPGRWFATLWWPILIVAGAAATLYLTWRALPPAAAPEAPVTTDPTTLRELHEMASRTLDDIRFQQKHTSGWSGKIGLMFGAEASRTASREVTRQPRSYPQIVHEFTRFLRDAIGCVSSMDAVATPSVVIILDELDKIISPEAAHDFINDVKGLFNLDVPGFLFLVSVSEDALATFERRGLPIRDSFDSAFDIILRVEYLDLADARSVLNSRILGLPEPFVCLCHCMAGGLPRELIRVARQITARQGDLADVAREVVVEDLAGKIAGLRTLVANGDYDDRLVSSLLRHIDAHAASSGFQLVQAASQPPITPGDGTGNALLRLQTETLGYLYYLGTILEVFSQDFTEEDLARGRDRSGDASFDTLTSVRQLFAVNASLAWLTISAFRTAWSMPTVAMPGHDGALSHLGTVSGS